MPTLKMCRRTFFRPLSKLLDGHPLVKNINRSDMVIELHGNKPDMHFVGLGEVNSDRFRGVRVFHIGADEGQDIPKGVYDSIIMPALMDTPGSSMTITGTPKGNRNVLAQFKAQCSLQADRWRFFNFSTYDNPLIDRTEIELFKKMLPDHVYRQEILGEFINPPGQIYSEYNESRNVYQAGTVKFDKVFIGHDFGDVNFATAIIGFKDNVFYVEDVFDNRPNISEELIELWGVVSNDAVEEHEQMKMMMDHCSKYHVEKVFTGHDKPARLKTIRAYGKSNGITGMHKAVQGKPVTQTMSLINSLYKNCMLMISDKANQKGLAKEITSYHRKVDPNGYFLDEPDNKSRYHRLDAIAYCVGTLGQKYKLLFNTLKPRAKNDTEDQYNSLRNNAYVSEDIRGSLENIWNS